MSHLEPAEGTNRFMIDVAKCVQKEAGHYRSDSWSTSVRTLK